MLLSQVNQGGKTAYRKLVPLLERGKPRAYISTRWTQPSRPYLAWWVTGHPKSPCVLPTKRLQAPSAVPPVLWYVCVKRLRDLSMSLVLWIYHGEYRWLGLGSGLTPRDPVKWAQWCPSVFFFPELKARTSQFMKVGEKLGWFQVFLCLWPWHSFFSYPNRHSLGDHSTENWHS